ncbi:equilibrative nucleoside transporter 1-like [Brachionus plicatilis]|uniref:Equilibrative nucleoside transporter 1-like n=1 Tax=Brachionus plicatilis TaxID=10195 RepID=A0A3M7RB30_BRAPC|nr:equilibrative nucleoside transporter 1-like [Brachionus plicatilis]
MGTDERSIDTISIQPLLDLNLSDDLNNNKFKDRHSTHLNQLISDRFYFVYTIMLFFGIGCLLPWNVFITATSYFIDYKLNSTNLDPNSTYIKDFEFYISNIGQITNVLMNFVNIFISFGGNPKNRIPYTLIVCSLVLLYHIGLAIVDSSEWPVLFFYQVCITVIIMFISTGIMNSSVFYLSSIFPKEYINAIILGNNCAGCFTALASIISKKITSNLKIAAIYYFFSAYVVVVIALAGYFAMHRTTFYKYCTKLDEEKKRLSLLESSGAEKPVPYFKLIRTTGLYLFCIWLNFFSTLSIFPVFQIEIKKNSQNFIISDEFYLDIVVFLTFNFLVLFGNMLPRLVQKPGPKWIPAAVISRAVAVFVLFSISNFRPDVPHRIPVLITNDYVYWIICSVSSLLFGYFTSLLMMYTPNLVEDEHKGTVSMIAALSITIGVASGLQFTKILEFIVLK